MTRPHLMIAARVVLAVGLLAAAFGVMALTIAPDEASAPAQDSAPKPEVADALGLPDQAVEAEEKVAGASQPGGTGVPSLQQQAAGDAENQEEQKDAQSEPHSIVLPGLSTAAPVVGPSDEFLAFEAAINEAVAAWEGSARYAIAVTDLQTGHTVGANHERQQLSGCVMNYFVILRAVMDVEEGRYPLSTVDGLIRATTWSSNATTARELYRIVGGGDTVEGVRRVGALIDDLGLHGMLIDHPPAYGSESLGIDYNNWLTAAAVNDAFAMLWEGELVNETSRSYLLEVLGDVKPGLNYLVAFVPGEATVSHKNGFFPSSIGYIDNDAGLVQVSGPEGDYAYVVTFLSEGVPYKYGDLPLGQELMRMTWEYFAATYAG